VRIAGGVAGRTVAILGAGTIGLLLLAVVKAQGARRVVVADLLPAKRQRAAELGADAVVDSASDVVGEIRAALGESADVVFDCVAIQATVEQAIGLASKGGTAVIVGVPSRDVTIPLALVQDHEIRIQGSATYLPEDYAESIALLQRGAVDVDAIVTSVLPITEVAAAFATSAAGTDIKVLVVVDPAAFAST
jgi:2-desacetyl-2-hydroxyethyl bacteriochlorophyllide A dehydrogenase